MAARNLGRIRPHPLRAVGQLLGLSRERVRRIELDAVLEIRRVL